MLVMKFGGSSIRDAARIEHVGKIISQHLDQKPLIVFSAMGKTTDRLLEAGRLALEEGALSYGEILEHHQSVCRELGVDEAPIRPLLEELENLLRGISLLRELSPRTADYLVSFGERLAVRLIGQYLAKAVHEARWFDSWEVGLRTDSNFGEADILDESYSDIAEHFAPLRQAYEYLPVVTGFIGKDQNGAITTFGRGGSDLTASVLGAAVNAREIQVWKDVDGILTTDPRIAPTAKTVPSVTFEEASELAYFGAKVLHPVSMQPAMRENIPVRVKNSYKPDAAGTLITAERQEPAALVKALTCKRSVTVVDLVSSRMLGQHGFLSEVFEVFNTHRISVDMLASSEVSISLTVNNGVLLDEVVLALEAFSRVRISRRKAILSIIGDVRRSSEILDQAFGVLVRLGVNVQMISQGASKVNIGMVVEDSEVEECLRSLHEYFFGEERRAA